MAEFTYDFVVIGSGPGGYVCAIRAAQLGFKTACIEKRETLGGTCLNIGCIPSKALLAASEKYEEAKNHLGAFGVKVGEVSLDLPGMQGHKDKTVKANVDGVAYLFKKNKIDWIKGAAAFTGPSPLSILSLPPGRRFLRCPASRSTRSESCRRPARSACPRFRKSWW
jgi:dihydrolipoamide dehydrogenase